MKYHITQLVAADILTDATLTPTEMLTALYLLNQPVIDNARQQEEPRKEIIDRMARRLAMHPDTAMEVVDYLQGTGRISWDSDGEQETVRVNIESQAAIAFVINNIGLDDYPMEVIHSAMHDNPTKFVWTVISDYFGVTLEASSHDNMH